MEEYKVGINALRSYILSIRHWSVSESMLALVRVQMELCWTDIYPVTIAQMRILVLLNLLVRCGSILT